MNIHIFNSGLSNYIIKSKGMSIKNELFYIIISYGIQLYDKIIIDSCYFITKNE